MDQDELDEVLGISRCVRCGQRLDGEIECPVCSSFYQKTSKKDLLPKWIYFTACFLTSPVSIYFLINSKRLSVMEKIIAASGCLLWAYVLFLY
jgi:hypothetical protein